MKKLLCVILPFLFILFCSCDTDIKTDKDIDLNLNFTSKAQIDYQGTAFTAEIHSTESGCSAVFIAPEELKGMETSYNGAEFTYALGELKFTSLPHRETSQFLKLIYEALRKTDYSTEKSENGYKVYSSLNGLTYYLNINKEQHTPTYFEVESIDLNIKFG